MRANRGRSNLSLRRVLGAITATLLLSTLASAAGADTKEDLARARAELDRLAQEIDQSHARLAQLDQEIAEAEARLDTLQGELDQLAAAIDAAQSLYARTQQRLDETKARLDDTEKRFEVLRTRLDARARQTYVQGPAGSLDLILGSSSLAALTDRVEFVNELSQDDAELANEVQNRANELAVEKAQLEALEAEQARNLAELERNEAAIASKFEEATDIREGLEADRAEQAQLTFGLASKHDEMLGIIDGLRKKLRAEELARAREAARQAAEEAARRAEEAAAREAAAEAARLAQEEAAEEAAEKAAAEKAAAEAAAAEAAEEEQNDPPPDESNTDSGDGSGGSEPPPPPTDDDGPFYFCPVDSPRSYVDSLGAPRVGHVHAGNDIMAGYGTPIRAPFAGRAVAGSNSLGGLSVHVYGADGYVYNAHLSDLGTTGSVSAGTIIGYVGDSGNASGGPPHDHFEWHPDVIPSDPWTSPYGYSVVGDAIDPYPYLNEVC